VQRKTMRMDGVYSTLLRPN